MMWDWHEAEIEICEREGCRGRALASPGVLIDDRR